MNDPIRLGRYEAVVERPFTSPDHIDVDKAVLDTMVSEVFKHLLIDPERMNSGYAYFFPSEQTWQKRIMLTRLHQISCGEPIAVVGFFGKRRPNVSSELDHEIFDFGRILATQIPNIPDILGYYTWMLADELNYANIVFLRNEEAIGKWRESSPHVYVKDVVSPNYYETVRIYNGRLTINRSTRSHNLSLIRVKYFDYRQTPTWRGVREIAALERV